MVDLSNAALGEEQDIFLLVKEYDGIFNRSTADYRTATDFVPDICAEREIDMAARKCIDNWFMETAELLTHACTQLMNV